MRLSRRRDELADRVSRLMKEDRAARGAMSQPAVDRVLAAAWQFEKELLPQAAAGDVRAAAGLLDVARICLPYQLAAHDWPGALASGAAASVAASRLIYGGGLAPGNLRQLGYRNLAAAVRKLMPRFYGIPEAIAYAAHRSGHPLSALGVIEVLTNISFEMRMAAVIFHHIEQGEAAGTFDYAQVREYADRLEQIAGTWQTAASGVTGPDAIRATQESWLAQEMALPPRNDPLEQFFVTTPRAHALRVAASTGRTLIYLLTGPGDEGGTAIRIAPGGESGVRADGISLPALQTPEVTARLARIEGAFTDTSGNLTVRQQLELAGMLDWTGASVWHPLLDAWPDLLAAPLAIIPIGNAALLPLYTARLGGDLACAQADLTIAPSAKSLHFAAALPAVEVPGPVVVAADPWHGDNQLPHVAEEAEAVADIHGVKSLVFGAQTSAHGTSAGMRAFRGTMPAKRSGASQELKDLLREASLVHLACHGHIQGLSPALLIGNGVVHLHELAGGDDADITSTLRGRPLIILSACQVGGFTTGEIPGEQFGFPAGLMAMGARSIIAPLWPVPDSDDTIAFMRDLHQRLQHMPSAAALPQAVQAAQHQGLPLAVWNSFAHFGL